MTDLLGWFRMQKYQKQSLYVFELEVWSTIKTQSLEEYHLHH